MDDVQAVTFKKALPDDVDVSRLLLKLDQQRFPVNALLNEIKSNYVTVNKVFDGDFIAGILVMRAFKSYDGALCVEIDHIVAEDKPQRAFGDVLKPVLFDWIRQAGFDKLYQHTHTPALARALRSVYGEAKEFIFVKDFRGVENG